MGYNKEQDLNYNAPLLNALQLVPLLLAILFMWNSEAYVPYCTKTLIFNGFVKG
jgi:hypothetical protein